MSNFVEIYGVLKNAEPCLILDSMETEVSGNLTVIEDLDVGGNISFNNTNLSSVLTNLVVDLTGGQDASFGNIDISESLRLNNTDISGKLTQIDVSLVDLARIGNSGGGINGLYDLLPNTHNSSAIINQIANNFKEPWWLKYPDIYTSGPNARTASYPEAFVGGVLAPNGKIIFVPHVSRVIGLYDPVDEIFEEKIFHGQGDHAYSGGVLAPNGDIIFVPFNAKHVGIYEVENNNFRIINNGPSIYDGGGDAESFWGGVLAPNGKIIFVPHHRQYVGIYDPSNQIFEKGTSFSRTDAAAFRGGVLAPNGKIIFIPYVSDYIGIYNPESDTYKRGPLHNKGDYAFGGGVLAPNGKIIFVPYDSPNVGIYDPESEKYEIGSPHHAGLDANAFYGGLLAPNGKIIFVAYKSGVVGIYGSTFPLKNKNDTLAPYFNKL